ncbi:MAG TPA: GNAT family protein [Candidatus Saccharimonadales bacterium]|nr:GNAT family protein [Candidatus Saccharimonadales bacterium]
MSIEIRQATPEDRGELLELLARSQEATGIPNPDTYPYSELEAFLYNPRIYEEHRYLATIKALGQIVGHIAIEQPNPQHIPLWLSGITSKNDDQKLVELGGFFVDPDFEGQGIMTQLLDFQLDVVRRTLGAIPVSATWKNSKYNKRVRKIFNKVGGVYVGEDNQHLLDLFVFQ